MVEYACDKCGKKYDHKSTYMHHINRLTDCKKLKQRKEEISKKIDTECEKCMKVFTRKADLKRHVKSCKIIMIDNLKVELYDKIKEEIKKELLEELQKEIKKELLKKNKKEQFDKFKKEIGEEIKNELSTDLPNNTNDDNQSIIQKNTVKKSSKHLPKTLRSAVWNTYIGIEKGQAKCYVCPKLIDSKHFECGHIISSANGGKDIIENLRCVCSECNQSIGTKHMDEFKNKYFGTSVVVDISVTDNCADSISS